MAQLPRQYSRNLDHKVEISSNASIRVELDNGLTMSILVGSRHYCDTDSAEVGFLNASHDLQAVPDFPFNTDGTESAPVYPYVPLQGVWTYLAQHS